MKREQRQVEKLLKEKEQKEKQLRSFVKECRESGLSYREIGKIIKKSHEWVRNFIQNT